MCFTVVFVSIQPTIEKHEAALLILVGFGGLSIVLAIIHNIIRQRVYHDRHNFDTAFDAGANVTLSLTAVTVTSQMLWPSSFLHLATLTIKV